MPLLLLVASAAITSESSLSLGVLLSLVGAGIGLLTLAAAVGALFWRVARLEKDLDESRKDRDGLREKLSLNTQEVAVVTASIGRIEKGVEGIEHYLRTFFMPGGQKQGKSA